MGALFEPFTPSLASSPFFSGIAAAPAIPASHQWIAVRQRFEQFHGNLFLTPLQLEDAQTKRAGVVNCLNRHYHDSQSETDNSFMIGGERTRTSGRRATSTCISSFLQRFITAFK